MTSGGVSTARVCAERPPVRVAAVLARHGQKTSAAWVLPLQRAPQRDALRAALATVGAHV
jgi:hypothetical protein